MFDPAAIYNVPTGSWPGSGILLAQAGSFFDLLIQSLSFNEFLKEQKDYLSLIVGLACLLSAFLCAQLHWMRKDRVSWKWLAAFFTSQGLAQWLKITAAVSGDELAPVLWQLTWGLSIVSLAFLWEFGRGNWSRLTGKPAARSQILPWLLVFLVVFYWSRHRDGSASALILPNGDKTPALSDSWLLAANAAAHYVFGLAGCVWLVRILARGARRPSESAQLLNKACRPVLLFAAFDSFLVEPASVLLAGRINSAAFAEVVGCPVEFMLSLISGWFLVLLWKHYHRLGMDAAELAEEQPFDKLPTWTLFLLYGLLMAGCVATNLIGERAKASERNNLMTPVRLASSLIRSEVVSLLAHPDNTNGQANVTRQLDALRNAKMDSRFVYLLFWPQTNRSILSPPQYLAVSKAPAIARLLPDAGQDHNHTNAPRILTVYLQQGAGYKNTEDKANWVSLHEDDITKPQTILTLLTNQTNAPAKYLYYLKNQGKISGSSLNRLTGLNDQMSDAELRTILARELDSIIMQTNSIYVKECFPSGFLSKETEPYAREKQVAGPQIRSLNRMILADLFKDCIVRADFKAQSFFLEEAVEKNGRPYISGFSPVMAPGSKHVDAYLGMDIPAEIWQRNLARQRLAPIIVTMLLAIMMVGANFVHQQTRLSAMQIALSEQRYRGLFEHAKDMVYTNDMEGRFTSLNRAGEVITGYSQTEVLKMRIEDLVRMDKRGEFRAWLQECLADKAPATYELEIVSQSGAVVVLEVGTRLISRDQHPAGLQGIARDITERKRLENEQRKTDRLLECVAQVGNVLLTVQNREASIEQAVNMLCAAAEVDRVQLFENLAVGTGQNRMRLRYRWPVQDGESEGGETGHRTASMSVEFNRWQESLSAGRPLFGLVRQLPDAERRVLEAQGVTSFLAVPIMIEGNFWGCLRFDECRLEQAWKPADIAILQAAGAAIGAAIERQRAELAMEERQKNLVTLFDSLGDFLFVADSAGIISYVNATLLQRLGYSREQMVGQNVLLLHPHEHAEQALVALTDVWDDKLSFSSIPFMDVKGNYIQVETQYTRGKWSGEEVLFAISRDITVRKRFEEDLRASEEKFSKAFHSSPSMMAISTLAEGRYIEVNESFLRIMGYRWDEIIGRAASELNIFINSNELQNAIADLQSDRAVRNREFRFRGKDGVGRVGLFSADVIVLRGESCLLSVLDDITERKQVEQALREQREALIAANMALERATRLKDEFLASMSHELRTPLNAILGLSEALQEQVYGSVTEKQRKTLGTIEQSGRHLLELINDILDLSKIESGKVELQIAPVAVRQLAESSLLFLRQLAQSKKIRVASNIGKDVAIIHVDERRMRQVLINLLSNAVKFTPEGGQVSLEINGDSANNRVCFDVVDTGIGIDPANFDKLFKPFVQLDSALSRRYTGTGLGLALVRSLTEMHGGSVSIESQPGKGSKFTVSVPWRSEGEPGGKKESSESGKSGDSKTAATQPAIRAEAVPPPEVKKPLILLAEDNPANVVTVLDYLQAHGFEIKVARNGLEAVSMSLENKPALVLMDVQMPEMDGIEACRRLRKLKETENLPIIALTALAMPGDRERCLEAGMNDYLSKPVSLKLLLQAVKRFVHE